MRLEEPSNPRLRTKYLYYVADLPCRLLNAPQTQFAIEQLSL